jgi:hypothetical protein
LRTQDAPVQLSGSSSIRPGLRTRGQNHGSCLYYTAPMICSCLCVGVSGQWCFYTCTVNDSKVNIPAFRLLIRGFPVFLLIDLYFRLMKCSKCFSKASHDISGLYLKSTMWVIVSAIVSIHRHQLLAGLGDRHKQINLYENVFRRKRNTKLEARARQ